MTSPSDMLGVAFRFGVVIDGYDLGSWSSCKGLAVTFKHEPVKELGEHTLTTWIPGRVEYGTISLQRAMTKSDWEKTKTWLQIIASSPWLATENPARFPTRISTISTPSPVNRSTRIRGIANPTRGSPARNTAVVPISTPANSSNVSATSRATYGS